VQPADHTLAPVDEIADFDTVIDVRSPAEFAEDHVPGAINCPVLDDAERARVGTIYKQESPFAARKVGAVLVARNIARHIEERFAEQPKSWRPLVYCWRGGQRSGAFTLILREIGWPARRLAGGYKTWRQHVLTTLEALPPRLDLRVIAGPTGSGKSRLLDALAAAGAQTLHLEALAAHKGSVLGDLPGQPQPSQKQFETALHEVLRHCDPARPVYTEAESRRIGRLHLPNALFAAIRGGRRLVVEADLATRVDFLLTDYAYFCDAGRLTPALERLVEAQGRATVPHWQEMAVAGDFATLVGELLTRHYDPLYARSARGERGQAERIAAPDLSPAGLRALATTVLATATATPAASVAATVS
jgi:tRNA 2-selenouridine synthase